MPPNKQIAVLGSFLTNPQSSEYAMAEELGFFWPNMDSACLRRPRWHSNSLVSGVARGGGQVRGIAMKDSQFPRRNAKMNPRITEIIQVDSIAERLEVSRSAKAISFLPEESEP